MSLKIYERGYYIGHNHGVTDICLEHRIGDVRYSYQPVDNLQTEKLSDEEVTHLLSIGKIIKKEDKGEVKMFYSLPLMAYIHLELLDIEKLKTLKDEGVDIQKFLEYCESVNKDDYVLDVELRASY